MAIQIDLNESKYGIPFSGAYFRIIVAAISRNESDSFYHNVMIDVAGFATKPEAAGTKEIDFRRYFVPLKDIEDIQGDTFLAKCYSWVMTQPDMENSIAV